MARAALRALWFVVIPGFLAGVWLRYLVPSGTALADVESPLSRVLQQRMLVLLGLFLLFALLARYWRFYLPGGRYLSALPLGLVERVRRSDLSRFSAAQEQLNELEKAQKRAPAKVLAQQSELNAAALELRAALEANEATQVEAARQRLAKLAEPALRRQSLRQTLVFGVMLAAAAVLAVGFRTRVFQPYQVLSGSMLPGLLVGDHLGTNKLAFDAAHPPGRGELIVFQHAIEGQADELVKRVIGLPGDRITMHAGFAFINGWEVPSCEVGRYNVLEGHETLIDGRMYVEFLEGKTYLTLHTPGARPFVGYTVKPGELFVLGDNRNQSLDARSWNAGAPAGLPFEHVVGRVDLVVTSGDQNNGLTSGLNVRRPGLDIDLRAVDLSKLRGAIQKCLKNPPPVTRPPKPSQEPSAKLP